MLTIIVMLVIALILIMWVKNKSKANIIQNNKPFWAIGYALYFLTDIFTQGHDQDEALGRVLAASKDGIPDLAEFPSQHVIFGLKAYANTHDEISKIGSPFVIRALSEVVAVEARTTLRMATSKHNISSFIREFDQEISDERLEKLTEDTTKSIQQRPLSEEGKQALHALLKSYLMRSFERYHKKDFYSFSADASQKLVGDVS